MKKDLSVPSMISLILAAIVLTIAIFVPWWRMDFYAPQYPEGLDIIVTPSEVKGDIEIINGLNHYIGMKPFNTESFPELQFMPYIVGAVALIILITAFLRNKKLLYSVIGLYAVLGAVGIWDMYRWLKKYGHELDPQAPINMEPFVPPIIGENTVANFVTYSYFTTGAYLLLLVFILLIFPLWKDRKKDEKTADEHKSAA